MSYCSSQISSRVVPDRNSDMILCLLTLAVKFQPTSCMYPVSKVSPFSDHPIQPQTIQSSNMAALYNTSVGNCLSPPRSCHQRKGPVRHPVFPRCQRGRIVRFINITLFKTVLILMIRFPGTIFVFSVYYRRYELSSSLSLIFLSVFLDVTDVNGIGE